MTFSSRTKKLVFIISMTLFVSAILLAAADAVSGGGVVARIASALGAYGRPNVLIITVDTLRADRLSQYGYGKKTSPALDQFAAQATRFDNAYSTASWTVPATATILSGLHPLRHGALNKGAALNPKIDTLAERLKRRGYDTAGFSANLHVSIKADFNQGFDVFYDYDGHDALTYPDISETAAQIISWVKRRDTGNPFFIYFQPMNCHGPYKVPKQHDSALLSRPPSRKFAYYKPPMNDILFRGELDKRERVTPPYLKSLNEQYDTAVRYTTDQIETIFETLKEQGQWDNTLVILTADHGEELFDHGGFSHGYTLFNEVVHVPLLIKLPGQTAASHSKATASLMDLVPTVLDTVTAKNEFNGDGNSLLPLLADVNPDSGTYGPRDKAPFKDRSLLLAFGWEKRGVMDAVVGKIYKYISVKRDYTGRKNAKLLFNLKNDPSETRNLVGQKPSVRKKMKALLDERKRVYSENSLGKSGSVLDEMNVDALKALGYIQ